jgi:hypothetical protein
MPAEDTVRPATGPGRRRPLRRRRARWILAAVAAVVVVALGLTARLFVWPDRGMPATVSAIVSLDRPGGTPAPAVQLAQHRHARFLVVSLGRPGSSYGCPSPVRGVTLICFNPDPATTQGEAEFVGRLAAKYHWRSVALVTITPQDTRARLRMERCFAGPVYTVGTPISLLSWPYQVVYEWGALTKALTTQRGC